jgi:hypothetical protein
LNKFNKMKRNSNRTIPSCKGVWCVLSGLH